MEGEQIICNESTMVTKRGKKVFCKCWPTPHKQPSKLVFICHGLGEHSGRYMFIVDELVKERYYVFTHDHVGHGKSEGTRVHIDDFNIYTQDIVQHVIQVKNNFPGIPCFVVAHSLGGAITILTCLDHPDLFNAAVLIAPAIEADPAIATPFRKLMARFVSKIFPQLHVSTLVEEMISRNKEAIEDYKSDKLCFKGEIKAKMGYMMMEAFEEIERRRGEFNLPYLLQHGTADSVCRLEASKIFHLHTTSSDKTLTEYEGAYHQIFREPEGQGDESIKEVVTWIVSR